ncbi:unnamed protein product [Symbiodinium natans]|uniref:Uncharacterized protein n=1 Tax=Symbiodinium natans TaxID=878477 RepID=A0A812V2Z1_9DINO|nr:unnamed protein product [Symbiodinium natans]
MFRFLVVLSLLGLGSSLVLTDKTQPAVNASKTDETVALASEETVGVDNPEPIKKTAEELAEDKAELAQIEKQDKEGNLLSESDRKGLEETLKDEKVTAKSGSESDEEADEPEDESSPEIMAQEKVAAAAEEADSDEGPDSVPEAEDESEPSQAYFFDSDIAATLLHVSRASQKLDILSAVAEAMKRPAAKAESKAKRARHTDHITDITDT